MSAGGPALTRQMIVMVNTARGDVCWGITGANEVLSSPNLELQRVQEAGCQSKGNIAIS